jgi:hypothetical protein
VQALVFKRRRARRYRPPSLAMAIEQQPEFFSPVLAIIQHPMSHAFCSSFALHRCPGLAQGAPWLSNPETMPRAPFPLPRCTTGGGMHEARCPWHKTKSRENCVYIQSQCVPRRPAWWRTCAPSPCQCPTTARIVATLCRNPAGNLQSPNAAAFLRADNPARRGHAADENQTAETHLTVCSTNKVPGNPQLPEHRGHAADETQTAETHLTLLQTQCPSYRSIGGTPSTKIRPPKPISLFYKQRARKPTATGASGARRRRNSDRGNPSHCFTNKEPGNHNLPEHRGHADVENGNEKLPDATKLCWKRARQVVLQCRQTQPVSHELDRCACA